MSDTPRTDDKCISWYKDPQLGYKGQSIQGRVVTADFARELELENEKLRGVLSALIHRRPEVASEVDGSLSCFFCSEDASVGSGKIKHGLSCPYQIAMDLLGKNDGPPSDN